jgi:hypothetical protein
MSPNLDRQKLEQETVLPSIFLEVQRVLQQQVAACGAGSGATLQSLGLATTFGKLLGSCVSTDPCLDDQVVSLLASTCLQQHAYTWTPYVSHTITLLAWGCSAAKLLITDALYRVTVLCQVPSVWGTSVAVMVTAGC